MLKIYIKVLNTKYFIYLSYSLTVNTVATQNHFLLLWRLSFTSVSSTSLSASFFMAFFNFFSLIFSFVFPFFVFPALDESLSLPDSSFLFLAERQMSIQTKVYIVFYIYRHVAYQRINPYVYLYFYLPPPLFDDPSLNIQQFRFFSLQYLLT